MTADRAPAQGAEETACRLCGYGRAEHEGSGEMLHDFRGDAPQPAPSVDVAAVTDADRERADELLRGRPASNHWARVEEIASIFAEVRADERRRVVEPFETLAATFERIADELHDVRAADAFDDAALTVRQLLRKLDGRPGSGEAP